MRYLMLVVVVLTFSALAHESQTEETHSLSVPTRHLAVLGPAIVEMEPDDSSDTQ